MTATAPSPVEALLEGVKHLTREQRGEFFERFAEVLNDHGETADASPLSPELVAELDRRIAKDEAGLAEWTPAEQVINRLRDSLKISA